MKLSVRKRSSVRVSRSVMALTHSCSNTGALWTARLNKGAACAPIWLGMGRFLSVKVRVEKNEVLGQEEILVRLISREVNCKLARLIASSQIHPDHQIAMNYAKAYFDDHNLPAGCKCERCLAKQAKKPSEPHSDST